MKKLKLYNGHWSTGTYKSHHMYIAAHSDKHAAELLSIALYGENAKDCISTHYLKTYFNKGGVGNSMKEIIPTEPCVYAISELNTNKEILKLL